jgi:ABC-type glycerol-3-phosphate transport system substrate-binding protein
MPIRTPRSMALVLSTACAAAAIAGCGGGDDSDSTSSATTGSQADFVSQADAICSGVRTQISALAPPADDMQSVAEYTAGGVAILKPALAKFQALTPPEDLKAKFETYLDSVENQIQVEQRINDAATAGDAKAVNALFKDLQAEDTQREAAALGFTVCAQN